MRKLMWFAVGFAVSCAFCAYSAVDTWIVPAVYAAVGITSLMTLLALKWKRFGRAAITCFGCVIGLCWFWLFHQQYLQTPIRLDREEYPVSITVTDYSYETPYGIGADGILQLDGKPYQVRAYLDEMGPLNPGDTVEGSFRMRVTTPDGEKGATYHQGKGIFLLAYQRGDVSVCRTGASPRWAFAVKLRQQIKIALESCFSADAAVFSKGLLLGDTTDFAYETDTDFKTSGIRHVVAVSGLHISILFALISTITFRKRYLTALLGYPILLLFASVAGFTPSVCRACIMSALMLLAMLFEKEYDGPTALSFSALVMLLVNPLVITSISLQLSVASVAGIFLFREGIRNWLLSRFGKMEKHTWKARLVRWFSASVAISLSAMSLTTPLCALYFGTVSLVGVLTNLLTMWVISFIFYGLILVCMMSYWRRLCPFPFCMFWGLPVFWRIFPWLQSIPRVFISWFGWFFAILCLLFFCFRKTANPLFWAAVRP